MDVKDLIPSIGVFEDDLDPQLETVAELEEVSRQLDLESWIVERLRHCGREVMLNIPLLRDDGSSMTLTGFRIQHLASRTPAIGPVAFHPRAHASELRAAAMQLTWQAALLDLPFGGAAGALVCRPDQLSERELKQAVKSYAADLRGVVGSSVDVLTPGLGANPQLMAWMVYEVCKPDLMDPGSVVGKPPQLWGLTESDNLSAAGLIAILERVLTAQNKSFSGCRISIQGWDQISSCVARTIVERGGRLVAIADASGGAVRPTGLDPEQVASHLARTGIVLGFPGAESACNADVLESECDVLLTAAGRRQITNLNADRIKAKIVAELASGAVTQDATNFLESAGVTVVPFILATGGALISNFLEWTHSTQFRTPAPKEALQQVRERIESAWDAAVALQKKVPMSLKLAARVIGIRRVADDLRLCN